MNSATFLPFSPKHAGGRPLGRCNRALDRGFSPRLKEAMAVPVIVAKASEINSVFRANGSSAHSGAKADPSYRARCAPGSCRPAIHLDATPKPITTNCPWVAMADSWKLDVFPPTVPRSKGSADALALAARTDGPSRGWSPQRPRHLRSAARPPNWRSPPRCRWTEGWSAFLPPALRCPGVRWSAPARPHAPWSSAMAWTRPWAPRSGTSTPPRTSSRRPAP